MKLNKIAQIVGTNDENIPAAEINWLLTDSRSLSFPAESLFFAIHTARNNGHNYIAELYQQNLRYFVVSEMQPEFEKLTDDTSKLTMHIVYKSVAHRDQILQMPFAQGINMAHNRLQDIVNKLK